MNAKIVSCQTQKVHGSDSAFDRLVARGLEIITKDVAHSERNARWRLAEEFGLTAMDTVCAAACAASLYESSK